MGLNGRSAKTLLKSDGTTTAAAAATVVTPTITTPIAECANHVGCVKDRRCSSGTRTTATMVQFKIKERKEKSNALSCICSGCSDSSDGSAGSSRGSGAGGRKWKRMKYPFAKREGTKNNLSTFIQNVNGKRKVAKV
jgi:hypothetical protein